MHQQRTKIIFGALTRPDSSRRRTRTDFIHSPQLLPPSPVTHPFLPPPRQALRPISNSILPSLSHPPLIGCMLCRTAQVAEFGCAPHPTKQRDCSGGKWLLSGLGVYFHVELSSTTIFPLNVTAQICMRLFLRFTNHRYVLLTHSSPSQAFINTIHLYSPAPLPFPLITAALLGDAFQGLIGRISNPQQRLTTINHPPSMSRIIVWQLHQWLSWEA